MPFARLRTLLPLLALLGAACAGGPTEPAPRPALTALPRPLTPAEQSVIAASNAFSFALFDRVSTAQPDSNVFLAPLSASMVLGMALNGAAGQTWDEMRAALQLGSADQGDINAGYQSLVRLLVSLDPAVRMQIANSVWYERTFPFYQSFLDSARTYFDAEVQPLDFNDVAGSLAAINGWANTKTHGKIPTVLDRIEPANVMFLVDAIYFKGDWRAKFDPARTRLEQFHAADGSLQPVQLMHRQATMRYAADADWQAVDLPYGDSAFSMTVVLPAPGASLDALVDSLSPTFWRTLTSRFANAEVELSLPKVKLSYGRTLNDDLQALGMRVAFVPDQADFTRMSSLGRKLYVSFVKQKSYVNVDENGTEAAAVTVGGISTTSVPQHVVVRVDRPYLFVIRERLSGTILFMGKITSPAGLTTMPPD